MKQPEFHLPVSIACTTCGLVAKSAPIFPQGRVYMDCDPAECVCRRCNPVEPEIVSEQLMRTLFDAMYKGVK